MDGGTPTSAGLLVDSDTTAIVPATSPLRVTQPSDASPPVTLAGAKVSVATRVGTTVRFVETLGDCPVGGRIVINALTSLAKACEFTVFVVLTAPGKKVTIEPEVKKIGGKGPAMLHNQFVGAGRLIVIVAIALSPPRKGSGLIDRVIRIGGRTVSTACRETPPSVAVMVTFVGVDIGCVVMANVATLFRVPVWTEAGTLAFVG